MYSVFDASEVFYKVKKSVQELAPLLVKHGIDGINPPASLLTDNKKAREAAKCVFDSGLKWSLLPTPVDFFAPDTTDALFDEALKTLRIWAETGEKMGVHYAYNHVFPGDNERQYDENFDWHVKRIRQINKIMRDHGIQYGLEFLGPHDLRNSFKYPFIHTISGALAVADAVDKSVGFLFDTFHWFCSSDDIDDLYAAAQNVDRMVCFHLSDGVTGKLRKEQLDMTRAMPMTTGVIDSLTPYRMFRDRGYTGPMLLEPLFPTYDRFLNMDAEDVVIEIAESYSMMEELARKRG